jgi:hypothetical protein
VDAPNNSSEWWQRITGLNRWNSVLETCYYGLHREKPKGKRERKKGIKDATGEGEWNRDAQGGGAKKRQKERERKSASRSDTWAGGRGAVCGDTSGGSSPREI